MASRQQPSFTTLARPRLVFGIPVRKCPESLWKAKMCSRPRSISGVLLAPSSARMRREWVLAVYLGRYMSLGFSQWPSGCWAERMALTGVDSMTAS